MQISVKTVSGKTIQFDVEILRNIDNVSTSTLDEGNLTESGASLYFTLVEAKLQITFKTVCGMRVIFEVQNSPTSKNAEMVEHVRCTDIWEHTPRYTHRLINWECDFCDVKMETVVKTMTGKTVPLVVHSFTEMETISSSVLDTEGIFPNSNFLDVKVKISLRSVTGKTIILEVDSLDGVNVNVQTSFERSPMQLFVRTLRWKTITVDVEPSDTIAIVKSKIADKDTIYAIPPSHQRLRYKGIVLSDLDTIADYGIEAHGTLYQDLNYSLNSYPNHMAQERKTLVAGKKIKAGIKVAVDGAHTMAVQYP